MLNTNEKSNIELHSIPRTIGKYAPLNPSLQLLKINPYCDFNLRAHRWWVKNWRSTLRKVRDKEEQDGEKRKLHSKRWWSRIGFLNGAVGDNQKQWKAGINASSHLLHSTFKSAQELVGSAPLSQTRLWLRLLGEMNWFQQVSRLRVWS